MFCTKCGSESVFKSGFVKGEQRYRCKGCSRQFVPTRHHGKSETKKLTAILLYINGLSLRTIAQLLQVTATAILKWVRQYALLNYEKPQLQQNTTAIVIELDEVWHYLKSKKTSFGFGKHIVALPISSLTGNVGIEIAKHFSGCWTGYENGM
jgi:transposase-like protein